MQHEQDGLDQRLMKLVFMDLDESVIIKLNLRILDQRTPFGMTCLNSHMIFGVHKCFDGNNMKPCQYLNVTDLNNWVGMKGNHVNISCWDV